MDETKIILPKNKNCGLCGENSCEELLSLIKSGVKKSDACPFCYEKTKNLTEDISTTNHKGIDVFQHNYDFLLNPLPGEISAIKIVLPFRTDLVEKLDIQKDDIVVGRPMGAGCPIPHVLKVIKVEELTGLIYSWVVGPKFSRDKKVKDVQAYHMIGFEGIASNCSKDIVCGARYTFLPGFCMMNLNHTGLVNMVLEKSYGKHIRIEDIRILSSI